MNDDAAAAAAAVSAALIMIDEEDCFVGWLLNVPAACECIPGTDLLRQFYVLPY